MSFRYRYTGDLPNVFPALKKNGHVWVPNQGDTIDSAVPIAHPFLELVAPEVPEIPVVEKTSEPATPEVKDKKPIAAQESEDN